MWNEDNRSDTKGNWYDNEGNRSDNRGNQCDNEGNKCDNKGNRCDNKGNLFVWYYLFQDPTNLLFLFHALGAHTPTVYCAAISRYSCLFAQIFPRRGPWRYENLAENMLSQFFEGQLANSAKSCLKNSPLSKNSGQTERKRPGRGGGNLEKRRKGSPANYITYIKIFFVCSPSHYGVATISRLLKLIGNFCERAL